MGRRQQQGAALLMVLVALAMLAGGLTWLTAQGRQQVEGVRLLQQRIQARAVEKAALAFTEQALQDPLWRASPMFWQALRGQPLSYDFAGGKSSIRIVDLHTCFNVNSLVGPHAERARQQLLHLLGDDMAAERLVDSLIDGLEGHRPMVDVSEINLLPHAMPRARQSLCALPESEGWQLNANALNLDHLPLLDALYLGEIARAQLTRLITGRPPGGYKDASDLRSAMGAMDDEAFARLSEGLLLNGDHFLLQIETTLDGQAFRSQYRVQARGVVKWHARVPAQQMVVRGREVGLQD
ncbi:hypothetical protein PS3A_09970 [Pseudomonas sp. 3A(2025)]